MTRLLSASSKTLQIITQEINQAETVTRFSTKYAEVYFGLKPINVSVIKFYTMASDVMNYLAANFSNFQKTAEDKIKGIVFGSFSTKHKMNQAICVNLRISEQNYSIEVSVLGVIINLKDVGFLNKFPWNTKNLSAFGIFVNKLQFCVGRPVDVLNDLQLMPSLPVILEGWNGKLYARMIGCTRIISLTTSGDCCEACLDLRSNACRAMDKVYNYINV